MSPFAEGPVFDRAWWREVIIYQVYVHSFKDSTGNGIGDLNGVTSKLDYLEELGIDVLWLTPVCDSPLADMGYDVRDYEKILDLYGTMDDWQRLLDKLHQRKMRLIMDLVVNHTSNEHAWFQMSRADRENPKHDWYIWKDPKYDSQGQPQPPNNWSGSFGGPAWTFEPRRGQYYLHLFTPEQPDLNWDNADVREAIFGMMRFWLEKGIDGFRLDVINFISKVYGFPDAPNTIPGLTQPGGVMYLNGPNVHQYLQEMNRKALRHYDVMTVGEMPGDLNPYEASKYVAKERKELSMVFQFSHMTLDETNGDKWNPRKVKLTELKERIRIWQQHMLGVHGWNSIFFENHDHARSMLKFMKDDSQFREKKAQMLATLHLSLRGTIYLYQGQEIAMTHPKGWKIEDYKDIETRNFYRQSLENCDPKDREDKEKEIMQLIYLKGRDNARTPIPWDPTPNGGFTTASATPWLKLNDDHSEWNIEHQMKDPNSVWNYYKTMVHLRKTHPPFFYGSFTPVDEENEKIFAYIRSQGNFGYLIILNWSADDYTWQVPEEVILGNSILMIGNYEVKPRYLMSEVTLRPYEARIYTIRA